MGSKRKVEQQMAAKAKSNRGPVGKGRAKTLPARDVRKG